jgi:cytochrome P450
MDTHYIYIYIYIHTCGSTFFLCACAYHPTHHALTTLPPPKPQTPNIRALQERVFAEQQSVLGADVSKPLDFDAIGKMDLLFNCVRESLRMHPPLIMMMRQCRQDVAVKSEDDKTYTVPKVRLCVCGGGCSV